MDGQVVTNAAINIFTESATTIRTEDLGLWLTESRPIFMAFVLVFPRRGFESLCWVPVCGLLVEPT